MGTRAPGAGEHLGPAEPHGRLDGEHRRDGASARRAITAGRLADHHSTALVLDSPCLVEQRRGDVTGMNVSVDVVIPAYGAANRRRWFTARRSTPSSARTRNFDFYLTLFVVLL